MADAPAPPAPGLHDMSFDEFQSWYGSWRVLRPAEVAGLLEDAPFPWWVAGGWAIDAAAGRERFHEDVDVVILRDDLAAFRELMSGHHLWTARSFALTPLWPGAELGAEHEQLWVRKDAYSPWILDVLLTPSADECVLFKRDHAIRVPLDESVHIGADGVRYLVPELVLLYKARLGRDKDAEDFEAVLPHLSPGAKAWLADALDRHLPGHAWRARL